MFLQPKCCQSAARCASIRVFRTWESSASPTRQTTLWQMSQFCGKPPHRAQSGKNVVAARQGDDHLRVSVDHINLEAIDL
jgi:hypothetical protein